MHDSICLPSHITCIFLCLLKYNEKEEREKDTEITGKKKIDYNKSVFQQISCKKEEKNSSPKTYMNLFEDNKHKANSWYCM